MKKRNLWIGLIVYLSIFSLGHLWHGSIDAVQRLELTRAIIFDRSVITPTYGAIKYSPLQSIVMIPPYALGYAAGRAIGEPEEGAHRVAYRFCAALYNPLVVTLICVLYFNLLLHLEVSPSLASVSTFFLLFGTLLMPYARIMFSEPLSALLILSSAYFFVRSRSDGDVRNRILNFVTLGFLCLNNTIFILLYLIVYGHALRHFYRSKMNRELKIVGSVGLVVLFTIIGAWGVYNDARYQDPTMFGYAGEGFTTPLLVGLYGLSFSIGRGVAFYSPLTLVGIVFFLLNYHKLEGKLRATLCLYLSAALLYLLIMSRWHSFEGGWCWGPRFLLPFIPIIHILFPLIWSRHVDYNPLIRALFFSACAFALFINMYEFVGVWRKYEIATFESGEIPYDLSIFIPRYSALFNNWEWGSFWRRSLQYLAVATASSYMMISFYRKRLLETRDGDGR